MLEKTDIRKRVAALVICCGVLGVSALAGCKQEKKTASPAAVKEKPKAAQGEVLKEDPAAAFRKSLSREALDQLKPFDFELGRLKGRAFLLKAPKVEELESGNWLIVGEYAPEDTSMHCVLEPRIAPLGESMQFFVDLTFGDSDQFEKYQTTFGELFVRQSKYAGVSQQVAYKLKEDSAAVGYYTVLSTHGDTWTLTCAADSPGFFQTLMAATKKLADSISVTPDEKTLVPDEYSLEEVKAQGRRWGLTEHYVYRFGDAESTEVVNIVFAGGPAGPDFKLKTQSHVKRYEAGKFSSAWIASRVNNALEAEYSYDADPKGEGIVVKDLRKEGKAVRVVKNEAPLWNQDRLKACLRQSLVKKSHRCESSEASLEEGKLSFTKSTVKVEDREKRVFVGDMGQWKATNWMDDKMDTKRVKVEGTVGDHTVSWELLRIWPEVE